MYFFAESGRPSVATTTSEVIHRTQRGGYASAPPHATVNVCIENSRASSLQQGW